MSYEDKKPDLPSIDEISDIMPAISEYCPASRLPDLFKAAESDTLPVIDMQGKLTGIISEYDLASILPTWSMDQESYLHEYQVSSLMTKDVWSETAHTNISDLLNKVNKMHARMVPIVENDGTYTGTVIKRTKIIDYLTRLVKPRSLGGLATPLGVYITDGKHQAGAGNFGLFLTGVTLGLIIVLIETGTAYIPKFPFFIVFQILLFLLVLRFTPLAKIHAAEHQTINAIERGMPLSIKTIQMQPKEHERCGTNLMILIIGIQLLILGSSFLLNVIDPLFLFILLIIGFSFVFTYWKKVGMLVQKYFTTVKAPEKYIKSGLKAGEEILRRYKEDTAPKPPSILIKIWNAGLIQIVSGFIFVNYIFDLVSGLF